MTEAVVCRNKLHHGFNMKDFILLICKGIKVLTYKLIITVCDLEIFLVNLTGGLTLPLLKYVTLLT